MRPTTKRYERIAARIDETLGEGESGVLFIREDHRVQFPGDVQVFYVAPRALDALKRWIDEQVRAMTQAFQGEAGEPEAGEAPSGPGSQGPGPARRRARKR